LIDGYDSCKLSRTLVLNAGADAAEAAAVVHDVPLVRVAAASAAEARMFTYNGMAC
jgi:hypothetical protein